MAAPRRGVRSGNTRRERAAPRPGQRPYGGPAGGLGDAPYERDGPVDESCSLARSLERDGLVTRAVFPAVPPRVD